MATTYEIGIQTVLPDGRTSEIDTLTATTDSLPPAGNNGASPTDPDGDGLYEDVNGNDVVDLADTVDFFQNRNSDAVQDHVEAYDFGGNGGIDLADVVSHFDEV